jgi:hypothetical protein
MEIKKLTIFLLFISLMSFGNTESLKFYENSTENTVYVCGKSKIYHRSKSHSALGRCKSGIKKMTESKAKNLGKRVCKCRN